MEVPLALVVGAIVAGGLYLVLQRNLLRFVFGLILLSGGVNLLLFTAGRPTRGAPPLVPEGAYVPGEAVANGLPQALILTAIVISFGVTAFIVALIYRRDALTGSDLLPGELASVVNTSDPFAEFSIRMQLPDAADDYDILQYELDEVYDHPESEAEVARE